MTCNFCKQERYIFDSDDSVCFDCWRQNKINLLVDQSLDSRISAKIVDEICEHIMKNGDEINASLEKKGIRLRISYRKEMTCSSCLKERVFLSEAGYCLPCVHFKKHRKDVEEFIEKAKELTKNGKIVTLKESTGPNCPECSFEQVNGHSQSCSKYEIKITDF